MNKPILIGLSFGLFLLQSAILPFVFNGISQPDLWLVSIIIVAMIFKFDFAIIFALIAGFIQDLVISNFFGLHICLQNMEKNDTTNIGMFLQWR